MKNSANSNLLATLQNVKSIVEIHEDISPADQEAISRIIQTYIDEVTYSSEYILDGICIANIIAKALRGG